jgi:hypothetical protein
MLCVPFPDAKRVTQLAALFRHAAGLGLNLCHSLRKSPTLSPFTLLLWAARGAAAVGALRKIVFAAGYNRLN